MGFLEGPDRSLCQSAVLHKKNYQKCLSRSRGLTRNNPQSSRTRNGLLEKYRRLKSRDLQNLLVLDSRLPERRSREPTSTRNVPLPVMLASEAAFCQDLSTV